MPMHDIIVIGASAGGVEALKDVVKALPADLPAAVIIAIHVFPRSKSLLPQILNDVGRLYASHPADGEAIKQGQVYIAPPDHHLVIEQGHLHLSLGPKEQHQRPCINLTFRSAATAYGERVIGVVLTGQLDDGTAGLWDIKRHGGIAIVQTPEEAMFPSMPLSALREVEVDHTLKLAEIGPLLARLARNGKAREASVEKAEELEPALTDLTCPDCRGTIWKIKKGKFCEYQCRVGHVFSPKGMLAQHFMAQEKAIWSAVVALEEGASLSRQLVDQLEPDLREPLQAEAEERLEQAGKLRRLLLHRKSFALE